MRPYPEIINELVSTGLTQQQLALLLELVSVMSSGLSSGSRVESPDDAAERRRKYDREYKRKRRDRARETSTSLSSGMSTGQNGKSCDLSSISESVVKQRGNQEEGPTASIVEGRKKVSRGTRLPTDAQISPEDRQFALNAGMSPERIAHAWAEFVDYWMAVPGQRGTKLNWSATWRNRVRAICGKGGVANGRKFQDDSLSVSKAIDKRLATTGTLIFPPRPSLLPIERENDRGLLPTRRSAES